MGMRMLTGHAGRMGVERERAERKAAKVFFAFVVQNSIIVATI